MNSSKQHIQLRLSRKTHREIREISAKFGMKDTDVVRSSLHFGLPVFSAMAAVQGELVRRLVRSLQKASRGGKAKSGC